MNKYLFTRLLALLSVRFQYRWIGAFLLIFSLISAFSQSEFTPEEFVSNDGSLLYRVLLPKNFSEDQKYPVVLFLHGAGERGSDNQMQLVHGSKLFLDEKNQEEFPAIVIFPQCPKEDYWSNVAVNLTPSGRKFDFSKNSEPTTSMMMVMQLMDSIVAQSFVDKSRVYVGGLSMGGMGTFEILSRRPDLFAAAFPICGGGNPETVKNYADKVKLWVFHGAKDDVIYPGFSVSMVLALRKEGVTPRFTLYKDANHNSWDSAFAEKELFSWLFSHRKERKP